MFDKAAARRTTRDALCAHATAVRWRVKAATKLCVFAKLVEKIQNVLQPRTFSNIGTSFFHILSFFHSSLTKSVRAVMPFSVLRRVHAGDVDALREVYDGEEPGGVRVEGSVGGSSTATACTRYVEWGATPFPNPRAQLGAPCVATFAARAELGAPPRVFFCVRSFASLAPHDPWGTNVGTNVGTNEEVHRSDEVVLWFKEHASVIAQEGASSLAQLALRALLAVLHDAHVTRVAAIVPSDSSCARRLALAGFVPGPFVVPGPDGGTIWTRTLTLLRAALPAAAATNAAAPSGPDREDREDRREQRGLKRAREHVPEALALAQCPASPASPASPAWTPARTPASSASPDDNAARALMSLYATHAAPLVCPDSERDDETDDETNDETEEGGDDDSEDSDSSFDPRDRATCSGARGAQEVRGVRGTSDADDRRISLRLALRRDKRALREIFVACAEEAGQPFIASADFVVKVADEGRLGLSFVASRRSRALTFKKRKTVVGVVLLANPQDMFGTDAITFPGSLQQRGFVLEAHDKCVAWFTHAAHRRSGVMAAAVPLAFERARRAGARRVLATIAPDNAASARLALSLGFERVVERLACPPGIMRGDLVDVWLRTIYRT